MKKLFYIALISIIAIACKKEKIEQEEPKEYLTKTVEIVGIDTIAHKFEYNAHNQLSKIVYSPYLYSKIEYYDTGEVGLIDAYLTLPGEKLRYYVLFTYTSSNVLKSAVLKSYTNGILESTDKWTYKIDSGRVVEITKSDVPNSPTLIKYDTHGNISEINDQAYSIIRKFNYNDKSNPFTNSKLKYFFGIEVIPGSDLLPIELFNHNDCVKYEDSSVIREFTSEYNEKGLPVKVASKDNYLGTIVNGKIDLEYTTQ